MKKGFRNLFILGLPFLIMILINEMVRPTLNEKTFVIKGIHAMNDNLISKKTCSWNCYLDTQYCKDNHVKTLSNYFHYIDPIYFGIINSLHSTGNYGMANVFILVILLPFSMFFLLIKILRMQKQINRLKNE